MAWQPDSPDRRTTMLTPDELVRHLREAGAKRVYLSQTDSFRDGSIRITATYEFAADETARESGSEAVREMLASVFETTDDRLRFRDREWVLDWAVEPKFTVPRPDLLPLYDRGIERKYDDGFNLRNLWFAYEAFQDRTTDS